MIDAFEGRDVATVDIPGAFLQTKMPEDEEDVHVILDGRMAELLAKIAPDTYQEYVYHRRGQAYIYCKCNSSQQVSSLVVLSLTSMIGASPTKQLTVNNAPSYGMSMI